MDIINFYRIKDYFPAVTKDKASEENGLQEGEQTPTLPYKIPGSIRNKECIFNNIFKGRGIRLVSNIISKNTIR